MISTYPHLQRVLKCLSLDNYGNLDTGEGRYWPLVWAIGKSQAWLLNVEAERLSESEKEIVAAGEETEKNAVVETYKVEMLDRFLNDVFDGEQGWVANWVGENYGKR